MFCPNLNDPSVKAEFEKMVDIFGEDLAYYLWDANKGNSLYQAPNGERSRLFNSLYDVIQDEELALITKSKVYSKQFRDWFGDWLNESAEYSKVIDSNGEPLVVYHGSPFEFEEFQIKGIPENFSFFHTDANYALAFSKKPQMFFEEGKKPTLYPVFLNLRNIKEVSWGISKFGVTTEIKRGALESFDGFFGMEVFSEETWIPPTQGITYVATQQSQIKSIYNKGEFSSEQASIYRKQASVYAGEGTRYTLDGRKIYPDGKIESDIWNDNVFEVENTEELLRGEKPFTKNKVTGKNIKHYKPFLNKEYAGKKGDEILIKWREKFPDISYSLVNFKYRSPKTGKTKTGYRPMIKIPLRNVKKIALQSETYEQTEKFLDFVGFKGRTITEVMDIIKSDFFHLMSNEMKTLFHLLDYHVHKNPDLKVSLTTSYLKIDREADKVEGTFAYYVRVLNKIALNIRQDPRREFNDFITDFFHELVHSFSSQALEFPSTALEKEYYRKMNMLYEYALKTFNAKEKGGFKDVHEFVSETISNPLFSELMRGKVIPADVLQEIKGNKKKSILQTIVDLILSLFKKPESQSSNIYNVAIKELKTLLVHTKDFRPSDSRDLYLEKARKGVNEAFSVITDKDPQGSIEKALRKLANQFEFIEKTHTYIHKETGLKFTSVSELLSSFGYGYVPKEGQEPSEAVERGQKIGTAIHKSINSIANDIVYDIVKDTGFGLSKKAVNDVKTIVNFFKSKPVRVLSEVLVADVEKGIAGTIDLVIIDEKGRVYIYDFKTKEGGFAYYDKSYKDKYPTQQKVNRLQLSVYKHMLEKSLGIKVYEMGVVMLKPTVESGVITSVRLDSSYEGKNVDRFNISDEAFNRVYGEKPIKFDKNTLLERIELEEERERSFYESDEFLDHLLDKGDLTELEKILAKSRKILNNKLDIMRARYSFTKRKGFEQFVESLENIADANLAIKELILHAANQTSAIKKKYDAKKDKPDGLTPELLSEWKDYILTYDILDEIRNYMMDNPKLLDNKTAGELDEAIKVKEFIKGKYETEGRKIIAKWLTPYYNGIKTQFKEKEASNYRRESHRLKKQGLSKLEILEKLGTLEEYVNNIYEENKESLEERTFNLLYKELVTAGRDIGEISRWLDNMLDTPDPVSAALVEAFVQADEKARLATIEKRVEMLELLRELEKEAGKGTLESPKEFYKWILEHDSEGNPTGYIIKPFKSSLINEESKLRKHLRETLSLEEINNKVMEWRRERFVILEEDQVDFDNEITNFLFQELNRGAITEKEFDLIQQIRATGKSDVFQLAAKGLLSDYAAESFGSFLSATRWKYYTFDEKYMSPEWAAFMRKLGIDPVMANYKQHELLEKSDNIYAKFYVFINKMSEEADAFLPNSFRLGYRLPGVAKTSSERLKEGQSPSTYFKETYKDTIFVRPQDTERGGREFTDERGNPKYFLPIHYTAKLELQNQSYDIATVYFKFWDSANDFREKREILPKIEMARYLVEKRGAYKRAAMGEIVHRLKRGLKQDTQEGVIESTTNIASMLGDFLDMALYGQKSRQKTKIKIGDKYELDLMKAVDKLNAYTSMNLLGLNVVQGVANVMIGEAMQAIDTIAHEHVSPKTLTQGTIKYSQWLPSMLGDYGSRSINSVGGALIERFGIMHEDPSHLDFSRSSRIGQIQTDNPIFLLQHCGEHWMQGRFLFALLYEKQAIGKDGKILGSMINYYQIKNGKLIVKDEVDLQKSKWTEVDQTRFMRRAKGLLSRMHGEYSDLGRIAAQRTAIGRLAYVFRKFIVPGIKRRYGRKQYIQRIDQTVEGAYISTFKFAKRLFTEDWMIFKMSVLSEEWTALSSHEKANIHRTLSEIALVTAVWILASVLYNLKGDDDDDDLLVNFASYQLYRLKAELLFFTPKIDETMSILRSPMASMSIIENTIRLISQLFDVTDVYERGPWKGQPKIKKTMINFIPAYKQYYKVRDVRESITWFK